MKYLFVFVFSFAWACKERPPCIFQFNELLNFSQKVIVVNRLNEQTQMIDIGIDTVIGGRYSFYPNGRLQSYKFFANDSVYTYNEEYSLSGILERSQGKPLMYKIIKEAGKDSAFFKFYLSALNKDYEEIKVTFENDKKISIRIINDTTFSNTKLISFGCDIRGYQDFNITSEIVYREICTGKTKKFVDTLQLHNDIQK